MERKRAPAPRTPNDEESRRKGFAAAHGDEANRILAGLPLADYSAILPQLAPVSLQFKQVLVEPSQPISHVYFVRDGVASVIANQSSDDAVEVGIIGREGFVGLPVLFGATSQPFEVLIQVEGDAWRMSADAFRALLRDGASLTQACLRYAQFFTIQSAQSVACNRLHTVEERCARWLLMTLDRLHGNTFALTHEFLAVMLGVRRAGVTVAMSALQNLGMVVYARGLVTVLDRRRLEGAACECHRITRNSWDQLGMGEPSERRR
jgi:CRP-like cAMP-binding protein